MSAFTDLLQFATELTPVQSKRFLDLLSAHITEEQRQVNLLLADTSADSKPFEVVAIAGTRETLLSDVTDTNVGEIKYGDTVECIAACSAPLDCDDDPTFYKGYKIEVEDVFEDYIYLSQGIHSRYKKSHFRKVSTPSINPIQTVSGC
jgi:hypothetical protein